MADLSRAKNMKMTGNAGRRVETALADGQYSHGEGRSPMHPDAETRILSLAWSLEEPNRSAFIKVATEAIEKLGTNAYGPGAVHRLLAPLWRQFFHAPSETSGLNRSRAYDASDDDHETRALRKFGRKPVAGYAS